VPISTTTVTQAEALRHTLQRLFRRFGALEGDRTPCGKPLSMAHAHALMLLLAHGELTQQALGAELCIDKSNVTRLCSKMIEDNQLKQRPSDIDGRSRLVSLTARGVRLAREVEEASRCRFEALLISLAPAYRTSVVATLEQLVNALEALPHYPTESNPT
jgi:DNA-binding MarR family transcriptional regulator